MPEPVGGALDRVEVAGRHQLGVGQHRGDGEQAARRTRRRPGARARPGCGSRRRRRRRPRPRGGLRPDRRQVEHDADVRARQRLARPGVAQQQVVGGPVPRRTLTATRRVHAGRVAEVGRAPRLVVGRPRRHPVAEALVHDGGVLDEGLGRAAHRPATRVLERLRQVPVVERGDRLDAGRQQRVDEALVVVEPARLDPAAALRQDARPRQREAVGVDPEAADQRDVVLEAVVGVAGHGAVVAAADGARARR